MGGIESNGHPTVIPLLVVAWLDDQPAESIWLNSITLFEDVNGGLKPRKYGD